MFDFELLLLVELHFAGRRERTGAFAILVDVQHHDADGVLGGSRAVVQLGKRDGPIGGQDNVLSAIGAWANQDDAHAGADATGGGDTADVLQFFHGADEANLTFRV